MIFRNNAPLYWRSNLPVMPLREKTKKAFLPGWQNYCNQMPSEAEQSAWLNAHPMNNIGLPLGPASGLFAIDIDAADPELAAEIEAALPSSPWRRVGAKGCVLVYRFEGQESFSIKDADGKMLVECLAQGKQIVLPPSIHPETGLPYTASSELWQPEILAAVPVFPGDAETYLNHVLGDRVGAKRKRKEKRQPSGKTKVGGRHPELVQIAGRYRKAGLTGDELRAALAAYSNDNFVSPLPDYEVDDIVRAATEDWDGGDGIDFTELGNAKRLVKALDGSARYLPEVKNWIVWNGFRWEEDIDGAVERQAKGVAESLLAGARGDKERRAAGVKAQTRSGIVNMIKLAQTQSEVTLRAAALDSNLDVINTPTGVVDLCTGKLSPADKEGFHSKATAIGFDPGAACPTFDRFISEIFPDQEIAGFVQRWMGYCLTGRTDEQKFLIASGAGANGKSTLLNVLAKAMGDYAKHTPMTTFMQRKSDGATNDLAALNGARLVLAIEGNRGQALDTALVKSMTGGDPVTARFLHREFMTFTPRFKPVLVSNHLPEVDGNDPAVWRRMLVLPFARVFSEDEQDHRLTAKLEAELPGILRWAVEGATDYYREGLNPPASILMEATNFRAEMDIIGSFIEECCVKNPRSETPTRSLYHLFITFTRDLGVTVPSQTAFGIELTRRGFKIRKSGSTRYRQGLGVKPLSIAA